MANKRMFSIDVTESDAFLELPLTAQALYLHLGMRGDDDGFVSSPRSILRVTGCSKEDLNILQEAGYIIVFDSGVIVLSDWKINNYLRGDRYKPTLFQEEFSKLAETSSRRYILKNSSTDSQEPTVGIPTDNHWYTQYSIEENRVVEDHREARKASQPPEREWEMLT